MLMLPNPYTLRSEQAYVHAFLHRQLCKMHQMDTRTLKGHATSSWPTSKTSLRLKAPLVPDLTHLISILAVVCGMACSSTVVTSNNEHFVSLLG